MNAVKAKKLVDVSKFKPNLEDSLQQRAAAFLNLMATEEPGEAFAWNTLLKVIQGYKTLPPLKSEEVRLLRKRGGLVKKILMGTYNREMVSRRRIGVRATHGHSDVLRHVAPIRATALASARKGYLQTVGGIDLAKVPNTPELLPFKEWGKKAQELVKTLRSASFEHKLLSPGKKDKP